MKPIINNKKLPENPYPEFDYETSFFISNEGTKFYYRWRPTDNSKIKGENFNWHGVFELTPLIKLTRNGVDNTIPFIFEDIDIYKWWNSDKKKMIEGINVKKDGFLQEGELARLILVKNEISNHLNSILEEIDQYDKEIIDILKVYFFETEKNILNLSDEKTKRFELVELINSINNFFSIGVRKIAEPKIIEEKWMPSELLSNSYTPEPIKHSTEYGVLKLLKKKWDLYEMLSPFVKKLMLYHRAIYFEITDIPTTSINKEEKRGRKDLKVDFEIVRSVVNRANSLLTNDPSTYRIKKRDAVVSNKLKAELAHLFYKSEGTIHNYLTIYCNKNNQLFELKINYKDM